MLAKLPNKTAKVCTRALKTWATFLGILILLRSNGGQAFNNKLFNDFCKDLGGVQILTSAFHNESNGLCECMVQEVK